MTEKLDIIYKKIKITGYRGRYFTLEIPEERNNTIFQMDGNIGKTTTIELLRWCFIFRESEAKGKFRHMWNNPAHVLDWNKEGIKQECLITVVFSDSNGNNYRFERKTVGRYEKDRAKQNNDECCRGDIIESIEDTLEINNGEKVIQHDEVYLYLNRNFKLGTSAQFAFFDGEKARDMMRIATSDINQLIRIVEERTTHTTLKEYLNRLNILKERLLNEAKARLTDTAEKKRQKKYAKLLKEKQDIEKKIQILEDDIKVNKNIIGDLEDEISSLDNAIIRQKSEAVRRRSELEELIRDQKAEIWNKRKEIFSKYNDFINLTSYEYFNEIKNKVRERGRLPEPYRKDLIEQCLNSNPPTCLICGRILDKDCTNHVLKVGRQIASHKVQDFLTSVFNDDTKIQYDISVARKNIIDAIDELEKYEDDYDNLDLKQEDLEMFKERDKKKKELKKLEAKTGYYLKALRDSRQTLEVKERELEELISTIATLKGKKPLLEKITNTELILKKAQESMRKRTIDVIQNVISTAVSNILGPKFSAILSVEDGLMLGENKVYSPEIGGYSGRLILSYIFAEAMSQVNPIIIDTPVGNIGSHRKALAKHLIKNHLQVILLCLPTELENFAVHFDTDIFEIMNKE